ncbi:ORF5 [Kibale red-tailed guenon virus 1]|uniref:ORF5 n=1 Tax=Kibale red-tailed guenon virus 1 TaxID=1965065 RepID=L0CQC9_9NIDO|nr:ORF5 [Kibale red-tailed guenon virus 1]AGA19108.1 ORF5 [Kibale red-tailed guenon virus 1]
MAVASLGPRTLALTFFLNVLSVHCFDNNITAQVCLPTGLGTLGLNMQIEINTTRASNYQSLKQNNFTQLVYRLWPHFQHLPLLFNCTAGGLTYNETSYCFHCNVSSQQLDPTPLQYLYLHPVPLVMLILAAISLSV